MRLDSLLVVRGLAKDEAQAKSLIMAGYVYSGSMRLTKAGQDVPLTLPLEVRERKSHPWVSRGGIKLAHGLEYFSIRPQGWIAADIGASTGGFTDVLLSHGAAKVYAVDVGYGELAWKLRQDPRVIVLERTNARYVTREAIPEPLDLVVCDASFIGLETVLPAPLALTAPQAALLALIKPQFEVERGEVGKKGVVTDPILHERVCRRIAAWLEDTMHFRVIGITESPILGPQGNKEFLIGAVRHGL